MYTSHPSHFHYSQLIAVTLDPYVTLLFMYVYGISNIDSDALSTQLADSVHLHPSEIMKPIFPYSGNISPPLTCYELVHYTTQPEVGILEEFWTVGSAHALCLPTITCMSIVSDQKFKS